MKHAFLCMLAALLVISLAACSSQSGTAVKSDTAEKMEEHSTKLESIQQEIAAIADKTGTANTSEVTEPTAEESAASEEAPTGKSLISAADAESPYYDQSIPGIFSGGEFLDSLMEMEFALDRVLYPMPFSYSDLLDFGWTGELDPNDMLDAREEKWLYLFKGESTVSVGVYNTDHSGAAPLSDCDVIGIEVNADDLGDIEFTIAKGITLSSTWQEIVEAYGEDLYASDHEADDTAVDLVYAISGKYSVEMSIDNESPEDNEISLYWDLDR